MGGSISAALARAIRSSPTRSSRSASLSSVTTNASSVRSPLLHVGLQPRRGLGLARGRGQLPAPAGVQPASLTVALDDWLVPPDSQTRLQSPPAGQESSRSRSPRPRSSPSPPTLPVRDHPIIHPHPPAANQPLAQAGPAAATQAPAVTSRNVTAWTAAGQSLPRRPWSGDLRHRQPSAGTNPGTGTTKATVASTEFR